MDSNEEPKAKKHRPKNIRKFQSSWLDENIFKGQLTHLTENEKAFYIAIKPSDIANLN